MRHAIWIAMLAGLLCCGCSTSKAPVAQGVSANAQLSLLQYQQKMNAIFDAQLTEYRTQSLAEVDANANAAIRAEVGADGRANAINLSLIEQKRLEQYRAVEAICSAMRGKFIAASRDGENAATYLGALNEYFTQTTSTAQTVQAASDGAVSLIDQYLMAKRASTASLPKPATVPPPPPK